MKEIGYLIVAVIFLYVMYHMYHNNDDTEPWVDPKTIAMIVAFVVVVPIGVPIMLAVSYCFKK